MLKKYTHLFFDLDNTIWDFDSNSYDALHEALKKTGLLSKIGSYEEYYKIFDSVNEGLWALYREGKMSKKILRVQRFEESLEKNGTPFPAMGEMINTAYMAEMPGLTRLVDGARELLDYLHGKYEMAVITNGFKEVQYKKVDQSGLAKYFKKVFVSEVIGAQKPKRAIFEYALKSMNARKMNSLMIGDSWEADILGAMQFGIDQIYYSPEGGVNGFGFNSHANTNSNISVDRVNVSTGKAFLTNQSKSNNTSTIIITSLSELFNIL
jgi:YjjG family noncanonical pyrimidine nucleotidase